MFENAIVKFQCGSVDALSREEFICSRRFVLGKRINSIVEEDGFSFAELFLIKQRLDKDKNAKKFMDTRFLVPISNVRQSITPANLESPVFLHVN